MKKIRIGKDISVRWPILTNGEAESLDGRDLKLFIKSQYNVAKEIEFSTEDNIVFFTYPGTEQQMLGIYKLTLWENYGKRGQTAVDCCEAFQLVSCTCKEESDCGGFTPEEVALEPSTIEVGIGSTGSSLPAGGTAGQVLTKKSDADGDAGWADAPAGGAAALPFKVVAIDFDGKTNTTLTDEQMAALDEASCLVVKNSVYNNGVNGGIAYPLVLWRSYQYSNNFYLWDYGTDPVFYADYQISRKKIVVGYVKLPSTASLSDEVTAEESDTASSDLATIGEPDTIAEE